MVAVALALALAAVIADFIPNDSQSPLTWLLAGALVGRLEVRREDASEADQPPEKVRSETRYARDTGTVAARASEAPPKRQTIPYRREFGKAKP